MNVRDIHPPVEHHAAFDLYTLNRVTDTSGCYCLTNESGEILYIGQATSIQQRLIQHFDSDKRFALTRYGRVSRASWRAELVIRLDALERGWIETARLRDGDLPPMNHLSAPT